MQICHIRVTGKDDHTNADHWYDTVEADDKGVTWRANLFHLRTLHDSVFYRTRVIADKSFTLRELKISINCIHQHQW